MSSLRPPAGVDVKRAPEHCCALEWEIPAGDGDGHVMLRVHRPIDPGPRRAGRPARVEIRTGPASFGPDITDPAALRRLGWAFLSSCQLLAAALEAQADPAAAAVVADGPGPPAEDDLDDQQTTLFDQLVAAGLLPATAPDAPGETT